MVKALLIANVGNRDIKLDDQGDKRESTRQLGERILNNFEHYYNVIQLPLIEPALKYLQEEQGYEIGAIEFILFATDQGETAGDKREQDTLRLAEVAKNYLIKRYGINKKGIRIEVIESNPADYRNMMEFYDQKMRRLRDWLNSKNDGEFPRIYLEIMGGTPAMVTMLILKATQYFERNVSTLYNDNGQVFDISIAEELFLQNVREELLLQTELFAYRSAWETLQQYPKVVKNSDEREILLYLLQYGDRRLAFDYDRALKHLKEVRGSTTGELQSVVSRWLNEFKPEDTQFLLAELVYSIEIIIKLGNYSELTQRIFRFQEAMFRYMAEQMGMEYSKSSKATGEYVDPSWVKSQEGLEQFLQAYDRTADGQATAVDIKRSLNRFSLGAIVDFFVKNQQEWQHWRQAAESLHGLTNLAELRNKGISGHGFQGIGEEDILEAYGIDEIDDLVRDLKEIYRIVFGDELLNNVYDEINKVCRDIIEED